MPEYVQRKRTKGWRMPPNTRYAGRPSLWANPFKTAESYRRWLLEDVVTTTDLIEPNWEVGVMAKRRSVILREVEEWEGYNWSCWCQDPEECHATVLLELANGSGQ